MTKSDLLHLGFALSTVMTLLKGSDLLLRPHQQQQLQDFVDRLALWLSYRRPILWLHHLSSRTSLNVLALVALVLLFPLSRSVLLPIMMKSLSHDPVATFGAFILCFVLRRSANTVESISLAYLAGRDLREKGMEIGFFRLVARWLGVVGLIATITVVLFFFISYSLYAFLALAGVPPDLQLVVMFATISSGMWFITLLTVTGVGVAVLVAAVLFVFAHLILRAAEASIWRVAEYNKGPVARYKYPFVGEPRCRGALVEDYGAEIVWPNKRVEPSGLNFVAYGMRRWAGGSRARR